MYLIIRFSAFSTRITYPLGRLFVRWKIFFHQLAFVTATSIGNVLMQGILYPLMLIMQPRTIHNIKSNNTKRSSRVFRLRDVPWKHSRMTRIGLLMISANRTGALMVQNRARGIVLNKSNHEGAIVYTSTPIDLKSAYKSATMKPTELRFDTDSYKIKIDNCCTRSITPSINDFVGPVETVHGKAIKGFGGTTTPIKHSGTVRWLIDDDNGVTRELLIPNTYHVPNAPSRLLSPQHWAQEANDNEPINNGTWCATYADSIVLNWSQRSHSKTISLDDKAQNVATMWSSSGYDKYTAYDASVHQPICFDTNVISDDEDEYGTDDDQPEEPPDMHEPADPTHNIDKTPPSLRASGLW